MYSHVSHHSHRIHVRLAASLSVCFVQFWCHPTTCPSAWISLRKLEYLVLQYGKPKIGDLESTVFTDEYVISFDVPMYHVLLVQVFYC